ncbi:MAG TPA: 3'-5' exonuclease [Pseudorhizobium sp.]|nr:3'-5' exonuclease [Pseudorhizobium sp.]
MRDLMIDIETLGSRPGSVILTIGAVSFDAETGQMGEEFYAAIDPATAAEVGLTTDIATMIWWMKQSDEARQAAFSGLTPIGTALAELGDYVRRADASRVWAKPPSFDLILLEAAFRACGIDVPWHFRTHRDCRTIFDLTGTLQPNFGTAHNALDDAKGQAFGVIAAYSKLRQAPSPQTNVEGRIAELEAENERLRKMLAGCDWYWPEDDTSSAACADGPWQIAENCDVKPGEVFAYSRGGVVETRYYGFLEAAEDADSDDQFEADEPTREAAEAKITAELQRRAALATTEGSDNG